MLSRDGHHFLIRIIQYSIQHSSLRVLTSFLKRFWFWWFFFFYSCMDFAVLVDKPTAEMQLKLMALGGSTLASQT